jgi:hypothetical protein
MNLTVPLRLKAPSWAWWEVTPGRIEGSGCVRLPCRHSQFEVQDPGVLPVF